MFDKLLLAACIAVSTSGCDLVDRAFGDQSTRTIPAQTAFFSPVPVAANPTTVEPSVAEVVVEPVAQPPVYVLDPGPQPDKNGCIEAWRHPCPAD